ncbi:hypothetical protein BP5796_02588 [Coleophoma crateriformis]|uniref:Uncharacterized protein n=1 Tax=Coleophoma crateriformis TaxID=565419 RepID=A0A3D8SYM3_9HELO|nr:hypothetical protein BP5796_02588 [Coleophoma crateriformis]
MANSPNWRCYRCTRRPDPAPPPGPFVFKGAKVAIKSAPISAASLKGPSNNPSTNMFSGRQCERIGCDKPVMQTPGLNAWKTDSNASRLCKQHQMEERHRLASRHGQEGDQIHSSAGPAQRSIDKKKLYRSSFKNRHQPDSFSDSPIGIAAELSSPITPATEQIFRIIPEQGSVASTTNPSTADATTGVGLPVTGTNLGDQLPMVAKDIVVSLDKEPVSSLSSDNTNKQDVEMPDVTEPGETPSDATNATRKSLADGIQIRETNDISHHASPRVRGDNEVRKQRCLDSLQADWGENFHTQLPAWPEPPGKTFLEHLLKLCKVEGVSFEDFKVGITAIYHQRVAGKTNLQRVEQFIKLSDVKLFASQYADQKQHGNKSIGLGNDNKEYRLGSFESHDEIMLPLRRTRAPTTTASITATVCSATDQATNEEWPQIEETMGNPQNTELPVFQQTSPTPTQFVNLNQGSHSAHKIPSGDDKSQEDAQCEAIIARVHPQSIEARRNTDRNSFQESKLDSFLRAPQILTGKFDQTAWGKIQLPIDWPPTKALDPMFLENKRKEIAARGNRKSAERYGKHLTPEVVKFRKEMGWEKHQNRPARPASEEVARHMRELFGLPNINNMTPYLYNGKLHMGDKTEDGSFPTKLYPVV